MAQTEKLPVAVGIDVGSTTVRCVIGLHEEDAPAPSIIGVGTSPSTGVRKGTVVDIENTVSAVTAAIDEAERISGITVEGATINVNGSHIKSVTSRGIIAVGNNNREISPEDLTRAEEAATVMQLPPNREIIQIFPRNYTVDGQEHVKDPIGMNGMRLEVDTCLITAATPFLKNTTRSITQVGINARAHVASPIAAARTVANTQDKEVGCGVLDIGAHTTGLVVFDDGELMHAAVLPVGAAHITNDIAIGLRTEIETAEKIKLEHVDISPEGSHSNEGFTVEEVTGDPLSVAKSEVNSIVQARLEELFDLVNEELQSVKRDGMLPGGVILSGGGANTAGIADLAKQELRLPVRVKTPRGFSGIVDKIQNPEYATVIGLMLEDMYNDKKQAHDGGLYSVISGASGVIQDILDKFRG